MTDEELIYSKVTSGNCHQCKYGVPRKPEDENLVVSMEFDCTIEDFRKCPIVIHDMSL